MAGDATKARDDRDDPARDTLARAAIADVRDGMTVGLGTGRAASRGIRALARRAQREDWTRLRCVATSTRSRDLAVSLGLVVVPMRDVPRVDLLFDGADELDPNLAMTKGAGGAMTWEKIVAQAARRRVYLMDSSKIVARLGERFALPVETLEFGLAFVDERMRALGLSPRLRRRRDERTGEESDYRTDEGNLVLDCGYGTTRRDTLDDLRLLAGAIDAIPGVIGHGLFVDQADVAIIESPDGTLERRERR